MFSLEKIKRDNTIFEDWCGPFDPIISWVAVSKELPELNIPVLVWNSDGLRVAEMWDAEGGGKWRSLCQDSCGCCDSFDRNVTYWSPLPKAPTPIK